MIIDLALNHCMIYITATSAVLDELSDEYLNDW
jgi:hypothetical protein